LKIAVFLAWFCFSFPGPGRAQEAPASSVEIRGDKVEYSIDGATVTAQGNVEIYYGDTILYCDEVDLFRETNIAHARGNVRLVSPKSEVAGDKITFNYNTMRGDLNNATFIMHPYYGGGRHVSKVGDNKYVVQDGYITTSDFDKPEYRVASKKIEIYPGDKAMSRHVRVMLGNVPLFYLPRYTQDLRDRRPRFVIIPGSSKDWGDFLLTRYNHYFNEDVTATVNLDYRIKLGLGGGVDVSYNTAGFGQGIVKTYYTQERWVEADHVWDAFDEREVPTIERERYKIEWRHRWRIDPATTAIAQYFLLSDSDFIKDFYEQESRRDSGGPDTFFLLTRVLPKGMMTLRSDIRVNRFEERINRLPEVQYTLPGTEIMDSGFYLSSESKLANLFLKKASPVDFGQKTVRFNTDNEIAYPAKIAFLEFRPFIGMENTYYDRVKASAGDGAFRGQLKTGASVSTKFYRAFETAVDRWGMHIDRLRHVITPSVQYEYTSEPTIRNADLDFYDDIDSRSREHKYVFSLDNKLQTKRNDKTVELLRVLMELDYRLKEDPLGSGFNIWSTNVDFRPVDWLTLYFDSDYDTRKNIWDTVNAEAHFILTEDLALGVSQRYSREVDNIMSFDAEYRLNPKWWLRAYTQYNVDNGNEQESNLVLIRDLHSWEMEINYNVARGEGSEVLLIFRLKAFPDIGFDVGRGLNKRKAGSQYTDLTIED
jgi:lipopolysaccharide assembly outer membrane protein LptD (OstA)